MEMSSMTMMMACTSTMLGLITAIYVVFIVLLRHEQKPREEASSASSQVLPGPAGLPIIGNAITFLGLLRHSPHRALTELSRTYGPIFSFRPGMTCTFVVLSSPALAREALAESGAALAARFVPDSVLALAYGKGSVAFLPSSDPLWKQNRVTVGAFLTSGSGLAATQPIRDRHARQLAARLRARSAGQQPVMVGPAVFAAACNSMSNILFSEDVMEIDDDGSWDMDVETSQRRRPAFKDVMGALFEEWAKPNVSDAFPFLAPLDLFGSRRRTSRNLAQLFELFDEVVQRRLAASGDRSSSGDMLDAVLQRHAKSQLTRSDIAKLFTDMLIGASETSHITVEWAMANLLHNPSKMEKLRAEMAASLGTKQFVEESDLGKLPYLHAVVKETLRLHPAVPVATREVAADGVSLGGFPMPVGTCILVNLWAIGRDPTTWPDQPEKFMPERFLEDGTRRSQASLGFRGSDFAYRPFGAGRRMCPGLDFAARFVPLVLASMLHKIDWRMLEGMAPEDVDLSDHCTLVLRLAKPLLAVPMPVSSTN